jgi:hypothetical protein
MQSVEQLSFLCDELSGGGKQIVSKKRKSKQKKCLLDTEEVNKKMFGDGKTKTESPSEAVDDVMDDNADEGGEEDGHNFDDIMGLDITGRFIDIVLYLTVENHVSLTVIS